VSSEIDHKLKKGVNDASNDDAWLVPHDYGGTGAVAGNSGYMKPRFY
jgi:hypothetical protein